MTVDVDPGWLGSLPDSTFPLAIDPAFTLVDATANVSYGSPSGSSTSAPIRTGRQSTGTVWRAGVRFNHYEPYLTGGYRVYNAQLQFLGKIATDPPLEVFNQGPQPTSFSSIGSGKERADEEWFTGFVTVSKAMDGWVTSGLANQWFGIRGEETGTTYRTYDVRLIMAIYKPPQPSLVTNLSDGQVLTTTTPTLQSQPVPFDADGTRPWHEFQLTTSPAPNSGLVVSSGMYEQTTSGSGVSWTVPQGSLQEGQTYWAWVLTDYARVRWAAPSDGPASVERAPVHGGSRAG